MIKINHVHPIVIEIILYRHNWRDNKLIAALKNSSAMFNLPGAPSVYYLSMRDMANVIDSKFSIQLAELNSMSQNELFDNSSSIYHINQMISHFSKLRYFKVKISNTRNYTRLAENKKTINFEYTVGYAKLNLVEAVDTEYLEIIKNLLRKSNFIPKSKIFKTPYVTLSVDQLFSIFGDNDQIGMFEENFDETMIPILEVIDEKLERDNTKILLMLEE